MRLRKRQTRDVNYTKNNEKKRHKVVANNKVVWYKVAHKYSTAAVNYISLFTIVACNA